MNINYNHSSNVHTLQGAKTALPLILEGYIPNNILDIGCGTGVWLKAAADMGVPNILGIDGVSIPINELVVPKEVFRQIDLTSSWTLDCQFDVAICLEVAEHLDESFATALIESITKHSNYIIFAAACPDQDGQNHVNCQWSSYWQNIFNQMGFSCSDEIRWKIWNESRIEPWYRQNLFIARRSAEAGTEARILPVIHPEMICYLISKQIEEAKLKQLAQIEQGSMKIEWYWTSMFNSLYVKLKRVLTRN